MSADDSDPAVTPIHPPPPLPRKRRGLSLLLLAGGATALFSFAPHWPKERVVEFRIDSDVGSLVGLDVTWTRVGEGADVSGGSSFHFEPGHAPKIVRSTVHLPDGSYALDITLDRGDHRASVQRTLTLDDATRITVPLR